MKKNYFIYAFLFLFLYISTAMTAQTNSTIESSNMRAIAMRLKPGEDVKIMLDNFIKEHHIKAACMITCCGSLQQATIRYADKKDAAVLNGKFEIVSLIGTLSETGSHLHISISDENGQTIGGHLKEGTIVYTTAEIVIGILSEYEFDRVPDSSSGYNELQIKNN